MSLCILAAGKLTVIAATAFTLSWTHSVEKIEWRESWQIVGGGLKITEARVMGSGAGMEPPEGSTFEGGWWIYRPALPPQEKLVLARSGATGSGWSFCAEGNCVELGGESAAGPVEIRACEQDG